MKRAVFASYVLRTILITLIVLAFASFQVHITSAASTALGNLVASMQPGTWAQLTTNNINATLSNPGGASGIIFGYTEYIKWDHVGRRLYYLGGDHATSGTPVMRHVQYDEASNSWSILPEQSWFTAFASHGYDHGAIDPAHRFFYFRPPGNLNVYRWNMDTGVWTQMPANNVIQYNSCCVGMDYFPELHGVMWASDESGDNGGVTRLNDATGQWDRIGQAAAYPFGDYHNFAEYNPVRKVMVFGGGEGGAAPRKIWKMDATGAVTPLNDAPVALGIQNSIFTVDPVSGDYLVFTSTNQFYVYNVVTDTWTLRASGSSVPIWTTTYQDPVHGVVGGPIDTYGVNVFVTCDGTNNCRMNIYKHSSGGSAPPPNGPTASITAPASGSTVSGTITVSANASSSVGVAAVQFMLDGNNLGSQDTASPYSTSWNTTTASNGSHTLTAVATDTAGNQGNSAPVNVTVSNSTSTFNFSLSNGGNKTVTQGQSTSNTITAGLSSGTAQTVSFSASGLPSGATASFSPASCVPTCTSTLTLSTSASTPAGSSTITVTGTSGTLSRSTSFTLTVSSSAPPPPPPPPPSSSSFAQKCAQSGVINCFSFDSSSSLFYTWPTGTSCDAAFAGQTNNGFGEDRRTKGNTAAVVQNGQCVYPVIDTTTAHSGAGSLMFTIPSNSSADSSGFFTEPFKRNSDGTFPFVGPGSPLGNVFYFQFYQKLDSNFVNTNFLCLGGDCGGWKQMIWYGNPPNGSSSGSLESTMNNGWQRGVPQMYGQQGTDDYGVEDAINCTFQNASSQGGPGSGYNSRPNYFAPLNPTCQHYVADQWMEFTGRIEIRGANNAPASRVQVWVNGHPAIDYGAARVDWATDGGQGFGQFLITPYHTNKDPNQAHPVGHTWYDDLIISTQPIAMGGGGGGNPPTVSITAPASGSTVSGSSVPVSASASGSAAIAGVQFRLDGANLGSEVTTTPYSINWNTTTTTNGTHTLTAVARDTAGNQATSPGVTVTVSNSSPPPSPTVSITSPTNGASVSGTITVSATASNAVGVQFQLDGGNLGSEVTGSSSSYSVSWNTSTASNASHTLTAIARNSAGTRITSSPVTVTVSNTTPPPAPTVSITSPANGASVSGTITVSATASNAVGVQFQLDGGNLGSEVTGSSSSYSVSWNTTTASNGSHTLTAVARNATGNRTSSPVTVTVSNATPPPPSPTVSITSPSTGASVSGTITVSATASNAVGVQFQLDGSNLGSEVTGSSSSYSMSWNTTTASNASHTLTAIARNAAGSQTTSSPDTVTVNNTTAGPAAKWTGGGYINVTNGTAYFGFKVKRATDGTLSGSFGFYNNVDGFTYYSTGIASLTVTGNQAVITGTGYENIGGGTSSGPYNFTLTVQDNGGPDTFQMQVSDPNSTAAGSTTTRIRRGRIHKNY